MIKILHNLTFLGQGNMSSGATSQNYIFNEKLYFRWKDIDIYDTDDIY